MTDPRLFPNLHPHPKSHAISSLTSTKFDVICIGSGWAGRILAARAVKGGLTAIIIENELVGGECPFWACVPSKAILRPGEVAGAARAVGGTRELVTPQEKGKSAVDVEAVWKRRDTFTANWNDSVLLVPMVENSGASLVRGNGSLVGPKRVRVESVDGQSVELEANHAVAICTGSDVKFPNLPGIKETDPWTPRHAASASYAPKKLIIMGAGAVGCEMATAYNSFGSEVVLMTTSNDILPRLPAEAARIVREDLASKGVTFHLKTVVKAVKRTSEGIVELSLEDGRTIKGDELLIATGRQPNTAGIGLEAIGIAVDGKPLDVDDSLNVRAVKEKWLYAVGDVNGRGPLSHICKYQGRISGDTIVARAKGTLNDQQAEAPWGKFSATADHFALPQVVFTDPVVASVGLTLPEAKKKHPDAREINVDLKTVGYMLHGDALRGWAQWVVDDSTKKLLGATFVGKDAEELLHASTVAIVGEVTTDRLIHAIPSFPTMSEVYLNLIEAVEG